MMEEKCFRREARSVSEKTFEIPRHSRPRSKSNAMTPINACPLKPQIIVDGILKCF